MFLTDVSWDCDIDTFVEECRNPLKSGQCFLQVILLRKDGNVFVAIPSNRVNVSYLVLVLKEYLLLKQ